MHCIQSLPGGYRECLRIDLQRDKKAAMSVNGTALLVTVLMLWIGYRLAPLRSFLSAGKGPWSIALRLAALLLGIVAYVVLHELTHAAVMKLCGARKIRFGFAVGCAFAGSEGDYFNKRAYRLIALAPLLIWALLLTGMLLVVPRGWFLPVWFIQIMNIAGSSGDVYVTLRIAPLPKTVWIRDTGVSMTAYDHVRINIKRTT